MRISATQANGRFVADNPYHNPDVVQAGEMTSPPLRLWWPNTVRNSATRPTRSPEAPTCTDGRINMEFQWSGPSVVQDRIADLLIAQWDEAGFNVTRDMLLQDDHIIQVAIGGYNVVTWRQFGAPEASVDNVWLLCRTVGGISLNWPRYCDEDRDAALLAAQATTDPAERAALYQEAEQLINDAAVVRVLQPHAVVERVRRGREQCLCCVHALKAVMTRCVVNGAGRYEAIWMD
jgi:hypothetical protein